MMKMTGGAALRLGSLAATIIGVQCGVSDRPGPDGWAGSVDTLETGRILVRSPDAPLWDVTWVLQERCRIGSSDRDGPELFGQIDGLELGSGGEVYVLDGQANEIRVFGSDCSFQRAFGREGAGPGELRSPGGLALDSDGILWVMDWGNGRYTGFDPVTGSVRRQAHRRISSAIFPWTGAFEQGERLIDMGLSRGREPSAIRLDTAFVPRDTLPLPEPGDDARVSFLRGSVVFASLLDPFAPQPQWAPRLAGGIVVGEGSEYRLHRIGFDGDTAMTMELSRERARVTNVERDSALAFFREMAESLEGVTPDRRPKPRATKPAHGALFVDDRDRTWVRNVPPAGAPPMWDVFGADGRFVGQVGVPDPPGFLPPVMRNDRLALATVVDGVLPVVIVYDFVKVVR